MLFLLKYSVKIYKKEPCELFLFFVLFCPKTSLKIVWKMQMWDQFLCLLHENFFYPCCPLLKFNRHHVSKSRSFSYATMTEAASDVSLWTCRLIQSESEHLTGSFIFASRQSKMNFFRGFERKMQKEEKQKKSPANSNLCNSQLSYWVRRECGASTANSWSLSLIQSSYWRSDVSKLPLLCVSARCHRCKYWILTEGRRRNIFWLCILPEILVFNKGEEKKKKHCKDFFIQLQGFCGHL